MLRVDTLGSIPDIYITRLHGDNDPDCDIHYETFGRLAETFGRNTPAHRHSRCYQLHLLTQGNIRLYLDDNLYAAEAPLIFLTPPAVPHAFYSDDGTDGHVITVRQEAVRSWQTAMPAQWPDPCLRTAAFVPLANHGTENDHLQTLARMIRQESTTDQIGRIAALTALGMAFFVALNRLVLAHAPSCPLKQDRGEDVRVFLSFCDLIEARFRDHITLPEYARHLAVTEARLNDICRRMAGLASKEVVHERLLQEARRQLRFSSTAVGELSYQLGFADPAYFSRFFTRRVGLTPSAFRLRHQSRPL